MSLGYFQKGVDEPKKGVKLPFKSPRSKIVTISKIKKVKKRRLTDM